MNIKFIIFIIEIILFFVNIVLFFNINAIIRRKFIKTRQLIIEQNKKIKLLQGDLDEKELEELKAYF